MIKEFILLGRNERPVLRVKSFLDTAALLSLAVFERPSEQLLGCALFFVPYELNSFMRVPLSAINGYKFKMESEGRKELCGIPIHC